MMAVAESRTRRNRPAAFPPDRRRCGEYIRGKSSRALGRHGGRRWHRPCRPHRRRHRQRSAEGRRRPARAFRLPGPSSGGTAQWRSRRSRRVPPNHRRLPCRRQRQVELAPRPPQRHPWPARRLTLWAPPALCGARMAAAMRGRSPVVSAQRRMGCHSMACQHCPAAVAISGKTAEPQGHPPLAGRTPRVFSPRSTSTWPADWGRCRRQSE
jgi:hypothetical protein